MTKREAPYVSIMATEVIEVTTSILKIGEDIPFVGGLCTAVLNAKDMVDKASDNQAKLEKLCERCCGITVQVVEKLKGPTPLMVNVSPLEDCVKELEEVAERYGKKSCCTRLTHFQKDDEDIRDLEKRISTAIDDLTAAGVVEVGNLMQQQVGEILARLQPRPKLAPVPPGVPMGQSWHTMRDGVVDRVYDILGGDGGPAVAALGGRSGAGKTTAAAAMVGERQGPIHPLARENEEQAGTRLDRLRARFSDGVVWLRVGKGAGVADRLPLLMRKLAKALHEEVLKSYVDGPGIGEDGESYVKKIVEQESLKCRVVADDVWEPPVVEKLRETGMWILLTARNPSMVEPNERVFVDRLEKMEAQNVLRGAARLPPGQSLCDVAMKVLEVCGYVAMDIAFVGSWSSVRTVDNCAPKSSRAWAGVVAEITAQMDDVRGHAQF
ncbi:expressed unknown protein [Ectocarpus siliculosus]|uniref:Uncharacterized protein n=1 Tax=Ectocarpus siliculosus TaxID=2880 RepID=D7G330_ECTSI|nr:expressed unknown protein [Ectocarpus siliculosus]|eukprot:CBJ33473.1 expressed unknown protein [Ectocarpus siliculosus]